LTPSGYFCDWDAKFGEILRCQAVQTLVNCRAQLEGDTLRNIQSMQVIVQDLSQTPVKLPCAGLPLMTWAAAFRTLCSLSVVVLGAFASSVLR